MIQEHRTFCLLALPDADFAFPFPLMFNLPIAPNKEAKEGQGKGLYTVIVRNQGVLRYNWYIEPLGQGPRGS
jgi:hypothetical protein